MAFVQSCHDFFASYCMLERVEIVLRVSSKVCIKPQGTEELIMYLRSYLRSIDEDAFWTYFWVVQFQNDALATNLVAFECLEIHASVKGGRINFSVCPARSCFLLLLDFPSFHRNFNARSHFTQLRIHIKMAQQITARKQQGTYSITIIFIN